MLSYSVDGRILTVVATGTTPGADRRQFYAGIEADARVPLGALLLVDARRADPVEDVHELEERAHLIASLLGPKMGPVCAIIAPPRLLTDANFFQAASGQLGIRVGIFNDEPDARRWLQTFAGQSI